MRDEVPRVPGCAEASGGDEYNYRRGNKVVFAQSGSCVECKATGERRMLKRKNGTFVMKLEVDVREQNRTGKCDNMGVEVIARKEGFMGWRSHGEWPAWPRSL